MSTHRHYCRNRKFGCVEFVDCDDANLERNHDGWPEVICGIMPQDDQACQGCEATARASDEAVEVSA